MGIGRAQTERRRVIETVVRMSGFLLRAGVLLTVSTIGSCGISDCPPVSSQALGNLPPTLSKTGLYAASSSGETLSRRPLAAGVVGYAPQFELWADGATKRRWIYLPDDGKIDTSDPNDWRFPEGTKIWKEFARDGKALETRLMYKAGPSDDEWAFAAYVWSEHGNEATLSLDGANDVLGTSHDVPSASACWGCHGGTHGRVLGFGAVQLSHSPSGVGPNLTTLVASEKLSHPIEPVVLPGTALDQRALGYLHANCGSCHNQARPPAGELRCYDPRRDLDLSLRVEQLGSVQETGAYRTALGKSLFPSDPDESSLVTRCERRYFRHMPPLGTEQVDAEGVALLRQWVASLPARHGD